MLAQQAEVKVTHTLSKQPSLATHLVDLQLTLTQQGNLVKTPQKPNERNNKNMNKRTKATTCSENQCYVCWGQVVKETQVSREQLLQVE